MVFHLLLRKKQKNPFFRSLKRILSRYLEMRIGGIYRGSTYRIINLMEEKIIKGEG
jgi:type IV secretory pathway VirB3-like protein